MSIQSDLLPVSVINQRFASSRLKSWAIIWCLTALAMTLLCVVQTREMEALEHDSVRLTSEAAPLRTIQAEQKTMKAKIRKIIERESWLTDTDSSQTLQLIGIISSAARRNDGRINVDTLQLTTFDRPLPSKEPAKPLKRGQKREVETEQRMNLLLKGFAVDDIAVASFVAMLREAEVFESVELKSTLSQILNKHETKQYEVSCVY